MERYADIQLRTLAFFAPQVLWSPLILFYFILFYFILFYFILFYSILFYSILFYSILFILFYFILFYFIFFLFYFILFYFILFYFILFYFILFYFIFILFIYLLNLVWIWVSQWFCYRVVFEISCRTSVSTIFWVSPGLWGQTWLLHLYGRMKLCVGTANVLSPALSNFW